MAEIISKFNHISDDGSSWGGEIEADESNSKIDLYLYRRLGNWQGISEVAFSASIFDIERLIEDLQNAVDCVKRTKESE